ncbi:MAG TPA: hypothetical protein VGR54_07135 [Nitrosopumilaceae archaeon]|nr:hypothetical protein [Nitrosopumilaceae archaeon]
MVISLLVISVIPFGTANAQPQKNVCILEPIDFFMDKNYLIPMITRDVERHNVTTTQINIVNELNGKTQGCDIIIQIERAINSNMIWVDKTTKYLVSGNSITIFTEKSVFGNAYGNMQLTPTNRIMTNWQCFEIAHGTIYQNIGLDEYSRTLCDPYSNSLQSSSNNLSPYVIQKSVDLALKQFGL